MLKKTYHSFRNHIMVPIYRFFKILPIFWYDLCRYRKYSTYTTEAPSGLPPKITSNYHVIEKAFSISNTRFGFGTDRILMLISFLKEYYEKGNDCNNSQFISGLKVLNEYYDYHTNDNSESNQKEKKLTDTLEKIKQFLMSIPDDIKNCPCIMGGVKHLHKTDYIKAAQGDYAELSQIRSSIRDFADKDIELDTLKNAVELAKKCPSTCNRQTTRVYIVKDKDKVGEVLALHGGARGFSENVNKLIILAGDLKTCLSNTDRNQVYVDGGLFLMNLLYSLQYVGIGSCLLHWAVDRTKDQKLRSLIDIKEDHTVACMIAIGYLKDEFNVPISQRNNLDEILYII